jgi:hypothetical protein
MAARWPTTVTLNLHQLNAVLAAAEAGSRSQGWGWTRGHQSADLQAALRKLGAAAERCRKAVERAAGTWGRGGWFS